MPDAFAAGLCMPFADADADLRPPNEQKPSLGPPEP